MANSGLRWDPENGKYYEVRQDRNLTPKSGPEETGMGVLVIGIIFVSAENVRS